MINFVDNKYLIELKGINFYELESIIIKRGFNCWCERYQPDPTIPPEYLKTDNPLLAEFVDGYLESLNHKNNKIVDWLEIIAAYSCRTDEDNIAETIINMVKKAPEEFIEWLKWCEINNINGFELFKKEN